MTSSSLHTHSSTKSLWAVEKFIFVYIAYTILLMACFWDRQVHPIQMLIMRLEVVLLIIAMWMLYCWRPCKLTRLLRVLALMITLSWFYPDTYEVNRVLPNLDHLFAGWEQQLFGCQPALLFSQVCFVYYTIFVILPVTGPQFYYLAVGTDKIAAGIFPNLTDWFLTHSERMASPGWSDGFFHHLLDITHDAGERPTAAFPSSHVGVTTVIMLLAAHTRSKGLFFSMLPFFILMCFSTVYIYAHYVIDAIAGFLTGIVIYVVLRLRAKKMELR